MSGFDIAAHYSRLGNNSLENMAMNDSDGGHSCRPLPQESLNNELDDPDPRRTRGPRLMK